MSKLQVIFGIPLIVCMTLLVSKGFFGGSSEHLTQKPASVDASEELADNEALNNELYNSIQSMNDKIKKLSKSQDQGNISTALLFEEIDKLSKALEAIAQLNEDVQNAIDASEQLTEREIESIENSNAQATLELYESTLDFESVDPAWQIDVEMTLSKVVSNNNQLFGSQLIECKTSLCKVTVQRAEGASDQDVADAFDFTTEWPGEYATNYDPVTGIGIAYLSRDDQPLPSVESNIH